MAESARADFWMLQLVGRLAAKAVTYGGFDSRLWTWVPQTDTNPAADKAITYFASLKKMGDKDRYFKDLKRRSLSQKRLIALNNALRYRSGLLKWRNLIVHGIWGYDVEIADGLIVQDVEQAARVGAYKRNRIAPTHIETWIFRRQSLLSLIYKLQSANSRLASFTTNNVD